VPLRAKACGMKNRPIRVSRQPHRTKCNIMSDNFNKRVEQPKTAAVSMPNLGEAVTEGTVTTWLKNVGDYVEADEPLLAVSTDKTDIEVPSPASGYLAEILIGADETVLVGTRLALIEIAAQLADEPGISATPVSHVVESFSLPAPDWIETITSPAVSRWLKRENDPIALQEPLVEVSTQYGDLPILSPVAGTVRAILVGEDAPIESGSILAQIEIVVAKYSE
jgi:pyruvate dehydrogenase E2 component (dihydrolipoamide acetyltransferase)